MNQLIEMMNHGPQFIKQVARIKDITLVLSATDKACECVLTPMNPLTSKIKATEQVLWAVLLGQMDADAAFFAGKASVSGSVVTAFRLKNRFLSLLQRHIAYRLEIEDKSVVK